MTTFNFLDTSLNGTQKLEGNPLECVSQCLISNGDPNSLAALLTELTLTTENTKDILKLDDGKTLKKYAGTDWANDEAQDSYYLHIKDGSLYVDYWRNSRFGPEASGEIVPESSTASLGLLALSALLIRRRRA